MFLRQWRLLLPVLAIMTKVLIVDDENLCSGFLALALEGEGFECQSAFRAEEAIKLAESFRPEFLITDLMLKDSKDGSDVARELMRTLPEIRVLFISGMPEEMVLRRTEGIRCIGVLLKPIDVTQVVELLNGKT